MEFTLTADQKLFRSTSCDLLDNEVPLPTVRAWGAAGEGFDRAWWRQGGELGWFSMLAAEEFGGDSISGSGLADMAIVAEEMGRRVSPGSLAVTNALIAELSRATNAADHADLIAGAMSGEQVLAWAVDEPGQPWAPTAPTLKAVRDGAGWVLHGEKVLVESGDQADVLVVTAETDDGPAQFVVPAGHSGVSVTATPSLDIIRRYASVAFDRCRVSPESLLRPTDSAESQINRQLAIVLALQQAETVGVIARTLEFTIQWAFDRYSFGRPLASYQALKHRFSDMYTWSQAAAGTTSAAVAAVAGGTADQLELVSVAKAFVGQRATDIVQDCVQLHGGIGVTWEHDIHLYLRRATVNRTTFGTPNDHLRLVAGLIAA